MNGVVPFIDLGRQHAELGAVLERAIDRVLENSAFTLGNEVTEFEQAFASYVGCRFAVGVGSGTDALHLALRACGVGEGDEVVTAVNTFAATAEAILMVGARPVFVEIDEATYLMDLAAAERAITERTKAIIPVHLYGQTVDLGALRALADRHGLKIIEDACQAHGAQSEGLFAGAGGDAGCFSFYPSKNLGALGDGGIVTTNDAEIAERVRLLRNHGENGDRLHIESAYCTRLHGLQAAALGVKLQKLDEWNGRRVDAARMYDVALADRVVVPATRHGSTHVYHLYVVRTPERESLRRHLASRGVHSAIHYPVPLHLEPAFAHLGYQEGDFPVAEAVTREIVSLPMFPHITKDEVASVIHAVREWADA